MGSVAPVGARFDEPVSPKQTTAPMEDVALPLAEGPAGTGSLDSFDLRADPDAQATVTDFLDFTEYLPSDMMRSLTLIGKLDQTYSDASSRVHSLTVTWGQLPSLAPDQKPNPTELRSEISSNLNQAVRSRTYSHAEAVRMLENVNRHYNRAKTIFAKLQTMLENYPPPEEQKSMAAASKSPQATRTPKVTLRLEGQKVRRPQVPRITVPGDVLAPYDLNYETYTSDSETSSDEEDEDQTPGPSRVTPGPQPRIKLVKNNRTPKVPKVSRRRSSLPDPSTPAPPVSTSAALAQLKPPPENAVIGSADAPWLRLTSYELARLRKRMKKNASWAPSDTMIARELKNLGRGIEAYRAARQKAEEEGTEFVDNVPGAEGTGADEQRAPSTEAAGSDEDRESGKGVKMNEAKKLAKLAAEEAEESARKMADLARALFTASQRPLQEQSGRSAAKGKPRKRKRDSAPESEIERLEGADQSSRPQLKRTKTETPVPPPQLTSNTTTTTTEGQASGSQLSSGSATGMAHSTTPIPVPVPGQDASAATKGAVSPSPSMAAGSASNHGTGANLSLSAAQPAAATRRKSTTPILPPVRETRKTHALRKQEQQQKEEPALSIIANDRSRPVTPSLTTPAADSAPEPVSATTTGRRPASRGKAASQEPQPSLAADRPRRASTARNTPAPEKQQQQELAAGGGGAGAGATASSSSSRPVSRRAKRPAPGVISRTNSGGNSAVGRRKAAPRKKSARGGTGAISRKDNKGADDMLEVEVDDEGNVIDPDEPRYCLCNRVSFGLMIQCDYDNCKQEWFHVECVGLSDVPARTTKWYCPECRVLLNIGEKGEVNARGVKM
ncbi:hypothetical protein VTK73DRAFT_959 [Phialemonium thermophilum]|uniref:PHD-type domain-containing protein n=1 Tax=Phialemonium thermophilum TaxID=223376 RepID=A0ABR3XCI9_9PEZI